MNSSLSPQQIDRYHANGYLSPLAVFTPDEVTGFLSAMAQARNEAEQAGLGDAFASLLRTYAHLTMPFVCGIATHPGLLDRVAAILGPDLLLWGADFFIKPARTDKRVSWHQDLTYWGLGETDEELTAWVALSDVSVASGCMRFVPGSHTRRLLPHRDTFRAENLLSRGQEVAVDIDEDDAVNAELKPGQVSFHHGRIFHASGPNTSDHDRVGLAFRYITPTVKQLTASRDYAMLMRGADHSGHWIHCAPPSRNFAAADIALREQVIANLAETLAR